MHWCLFDEECRGYDAPRRVYVNTPWGSLIVAATKDDGTQVWLPGVGYTRRYSPVVWHPRVKDKKRV